MFLRKVRKVGMSTWALKDSRDLVHQVSNFLLGDSATWTEGLIRLDIVNIKKGKYLDE